MVEQYPIRSTNLVCVQYSIPLTYSSVGPNNGESEAPVHLSGDDDAPFVVVFLCVADDDCGCDVQGGKYAPLLGVQKMC